MRVVTSFAKRHWENGLAKEMVETFLKHWKGFELWCYVDGGIPPDLAKLPVKSIDMYANDWELDAFVRNYKGVTKPLIWRDGRYEYKWDAVRFAHKVFALADAERTAHRDLIWLDADVISHADVEPHEILSWTEGYQDAAALCRMNLHPEAGFLWFNLQKRGGDIIRAVHRHYTTRTIFDQPEWHDGYLWGQVFDGYTICNLTTGVPHKHVWPYSPLARFCSHLKGPARKRAGADLSDAVALQEPDAVTTDTNL